MLSPAKTWRTIASQKCVLWTLTFTSLFCMSLSAAVTAPRPGNAGGFEVDLGNGTLHSGDGLSHGAGFNGDDWAQGTSGVGVINSDGTSNAPFTTLYVDQNWGNSSPSGGDDATQFEGTSNKNTDLIQPAADGGDPWLWGGIGGGPQKNDLTNVYVHFRTDASGEEWLIFGAETRSDNGDSHVDFEFNLAGLMQTGATEGFIIGLGPDGGRTDGDVVATVDMENGGVAIIPSLRIWDGSTNTFILQDLDNPPFNNSVFVSSNDLNIIHPTAPAGEWFHYEGDGGVSPTGTINNYQLVEIAANLTDFGLSFEECNPNATVIAKTRSSQSFTAELKDFALLYPFRGTIPDCSINGPDLVCPGGEDIEYTVTGIMPDPDEVISFLLGMEPRQRHFDTNLDGIVTVNDLITTIEMEAALAQGLNGLPPEFAFEWEIIGDAEFCDGTTTAVGDTVCVDADSVCGGSFDLRVIVYGDQCTNECIKTVSVDDLTPPEISCPPTEVYECDEFELVQFDTATATDDCSDPVITVTESVEPGVCPQEYVLTRVFTATDACGNAASCEQLIFVFDNTPPELTCPPDVVIECTDSTEPVNTGMATAEDNCDDTLTITYTDTIVPDPQCDTNYTILRSWSTIDDCLNGAFCVQRITVLDRTPPVITCPADAEFECDSVPTEFGVPTVVDACDTNPTVTSSESFVAGNCEGEGTLTITWTATDLCGNSSNCQQVITIVDTTPPVISCPPDASIECDEALPQIAATASDNCDPEPTVFLASETPSGDDCEGLVTRVWAAMDACGNVATCEQTISISDTTPPVITCPADATVECDEPLPTTPATAVDNCDASPEVTYNDSVAPGNCPEEMIITRTWTATDDCGNSSTCDQIITVVDTTPPVIFCPADATVECDEALPTTPATATDNCDVNPTITSSDSVAPGRCPEEMVITRTWTATDNCGNSASCIQTITVVDTTPPVITCPPNATIECDEEVPTAPATAVDNCDPKPTITVSEVTSGTCPTVITRVWTATDSCGNSSSCTQTITIDDTTPPVLTCPPSVVISSVATEEILAALQADASATDNCSDPTISVEVTREGICPIIVTRTFTATDDCGNTSTCIQTITIVDDTPPDIQLPDESELDCSQIDALPPIVIVDFDDPAPSVSIVTTTFASGCETVIVRTVTATDECGNVASAEHTLTLVDDTAPILTPPADLLIPCEQDTGEYGEPTVDDVCYPSPEVFLTVSEFVSTCPTVIRREWMAVDGCGNTATAEQFVTIFDTTPPIITCPPDATVQCTEDIPTASATAVDNCSIDPVVTVSEVVTPGNCTGEAVITRTWTATDDCGNSSSCIQVVTVSDTTPPVITCPADVTIECDEEIPSTPATAIDNCDPDVTITSDIVVVAGNCSQETIIIRTWTATDDCGNSASCDQIITIVDTTPPVITCPADATIECDQPLPAIPATAIDNCDPNPVITVSETATGECPVIVTRVWTATDACGNSSSCTQTITLVDTTPPVLFGCPEDATVECDQQFPTALVGAEDNCGRAQVNFDQQVLPGRCSGETTIHNVWTATDLCGNVSSCEQTVTIVDTTPPVILCPPDATVECDQPLPTAPASAIDNCDPFPTVTFSDSVAPGRCSAELVITRTWTATDDCGNSSSCVQTINVVDTTPPVITCPADATVECDEELPTAPATAVDNCDDTPTITSSDVVTPGNCTAEYVITRTWTATDDCGNSSSCVQTITVVDTTPPVIVCPADATVECDEELPTTPATATDNCDDDVTIRFTDSVSPGQCTAELVITRTWTAFDDCGNSSSCDQIITVVDTTPPVITCPPDANVECDQPIPTDPATAIDNCDPDVTITVSETVTGECPLIITRVWTATDDCGNSSSCTQVITVNDTTPPVVTCPPDETLECGDLLPAGIAPAAFAFDNCDQNPVIELEETVTPGRCTGEVFISRVYTATDFCGNSASCEQIITVRDTTAPEILCPPDATIECTEALPTIPATAIDICDPAPTITFSDSVAPGNCSAEYVITRTWTATDDCGNSASCVQTITVVDTTPPVITCPADATVECDEEIPTTPATAVDNCDDTPTIRFADSVAPGQCSAELVITRTWTATDDCGNSASCVQIITVVDTTPPVITCPADATVECDEEIPTTPATATDNCDPDVTVRYTDSVSPGQCTAEYVITRTWIAIDDCGNSSSCDQIITVVDTTPPVITCPGDITVECDTEIQTASATAIDNCDPEVDITFSDSVVPGQCSGELVITRTWTATDDCGNSSSCDQIITVVDTTPPVITCPADATVECDEALPTVPATAIDNCDPDVTITSSDSVAPGQCSAEYVITRTWTATDDCGNSSSCDQIITVVDTTPPVITCPADATVECDEALPTAPATATDNCDPNVTITSSDSVAPGNCPQETVITRTWTATDDCGNSSSCDQIITVVDTTPPVITCPADATVECDEALPTAPATAVDNCDPNPTVTSSDTVIPGNCPQETVIIRTWTATDACGNSSSCDQTITVVDTTPPVITCPADATIECDEQVPSAPATATDNCDPNPTITMTETTSGTCPTVITRVWTATDACGNSSSCTQTITIDDTTPPVISCPPDATYECDSVPNEFGDASATDNCDPNPTITVVETTAGTCPVIVTRTFTATDACGNSSTCVQIITIDDTTPPEIQCAITQTVVECGVSVEFYVSALDNCTESPAVSCEFVSDTGAPFEVVDKGNGVFMINMPTAMTVTGTFVAIDDCGNRSAECSFQITSICAFEACSPGYWRQPQHLDSWCAAGYNPYEDFCFDGPATLFKDAFGITEADSPEIPTSDADDRKHGAFDIETATLLDAISRTGRSFNQALFLGSATLLNSSHPDINGTMSVGEVKFLMQEAFAGNITFAEAQNLFAETILAEDDGGCPLN